MSADYFLDTNILVYAFEKDIPGKREIALSLMEPDKPSQISWQVIQDFSSVGLHKFKIPLRSRFPRRLPAANPLASLQDLPEALLLPHRDPAPQGNAIPIL
jgi:predicted nucleic acid-binding protein